MDEVREAILAGESGWRAMNEKHGGIVKPDIVFFGEGLPQRFFHLLEEDFPQCDLLLVMGTSLKVCCDFSFTHLSFSLTVCVCVCVCVCVLTTSLVFMYCSCISSFHTRVDTKKTP